MYKTRKTKVSHDDGFGWTVICYEDETVIEYFEGTEEKIISTSRITAGFDIEVFEEAIKLRKQKILEESGKI